tara:strand:+ start:4490 stop:5149 length:660 start_codon:yes stop_codon:yes gene_type:complete
MKKLNLGVMISGRGSNLQAIIQACSMDDFPANIALVISNNNNAEGINHASDSQIPVNIIEEESYPDRVAFEKKITEALNFAEVELVCLAGFMKILSKNFINEWYDKIINIHPSLLPSFKGLDTHSRAISEGAKITGCSVHYVRPAVDEGPIIVQGAVPIFPEDTPDTLSKRVLEAEHKCYPLAIKLIAQGRVKVISGRTIIDGHDQFSETLINPKILKN